MSSPFGLGSPGAVPPPPDPPRRISPLLGALIGVAVIAIAAIVVLAVQAIRQQGSGPTTAPTTAPTTSGVPSSSSPAATTAPSSGRRTEDGALLSSCRPYPQPLPLQPLGCTILSPPNVRSGERLPLVVVLHGFNTSIGQEMSAGNWDAAVVKDRLIAEFPESNFASWNAGGCCGIARSAQIDDVKYLQQLITEAKSRPDVDPARVYLVGNSNGGMMTYRYLCAHADELAGAASVEGTRVSGCTPSAPLPLLHVAARADQVVPYLGGQSLTSWVLGVTFPPVERSMDELAAAMGCPGAPSEQTVGSVTHRTWSGCSGGVTVRLDSLADWGHRWPTSKDYPATTEILDFFGLAR